MESAKMFYNMWPWLQLLKGAWLGSQRWKRDGEK
jgi:hypothetical protein